MEKDKVGGTLGQVQSLGFREQQKCWGQHSQRFHWFALSSRQKCRSLLSDENSPRRGCAAGHFYIQRGWRSSDVGHGEWNDNEWRPLKPHRVSMHPVRAGLAWSASSGLETCSPSVRDGLDQYEGTAATPAAARALKSRRRLE
ncbi:hypothetical protein MRX96_037411 [Rhipicephalus microplus]